MVNFSINSIQQKGKQNTEDWSEDLLKKMEMQDKQSLSKTKIDEQSYGSNKFQTLQDYFIKLQSQSLLTLLDAEKCDLSNLHQQMQNQKQFNQSLPHFSEIIQQINIQKFLLRHNQILSEKLIKNGFFLQQIESNQTSIQIKPNILLTTTNYSVIEIFCSLKLYSKKYVILISKKKSFRHFCYQSIGQGTFGDIFGCRSHSNLKFVIKCLKVDENNLQGFKNIVQEFMIADIMSTLEIGPKILRKSGFDFVLFSDCMEFEMEMCTQSQRETLEEDLKFNLFQMHMLKMVHCDIKPQNIMFSEQFKKNVFIDFGIADVLSQQLWEKTQTKFKGTYQFVSNQMKKILLNESKSLINFYINDADMLKKSLQVILSQKQYSSENKYSSNNNAHLISSQSNYELLLGLIFHICCFQMTSIFTKEFQIFIGECQKFVTGQNSQIFVYEVQQLFSSLNEEVNGFIMSRFQWKKSNFFKFLIERENSTNNYNNDRNQINSFNVFNLLTFNDPNFKNEPYQSNPIKKNQHQNLKYILNSLDQIAQFAIEEYFQVYLDYVSFWKAPIKVSVQQKQNAASVFKLYTEKNFKLKDGNQKYLNQKYLPEESFVNTSCKNLVWSYGFLLSYSMEKDLNDFKFINLMTIVKDCVFLSFKYDLFIPECLQKYLSFVIQQKASRLLTTTVIECFELTELSRYHFLTSFRSTQLLKTSLKQKIKQMLTKFITTKGENVGHQILVPLQKRKSFQNIFFMLEPRKKSPSVFAKMNFIDSKDFNKIKSLTLALQEEFSQNQNKQELRLYERAIRMLYFSRLYAFTTTKCFPQSLLMKSPNEFLKMQEQFDVLRLAVLNSFDKEKLNFNCKKYVEEKINCQQISFYFLLLPCFIHFYRRRQKKSIKMLFQMVFNDDNNYLQNLNVHLSISEQKDKLYFYSKMTNDFSVIKKRRSATLKLIQHLSHQPQIYIIELIICGKTLFETQQFLQYQKIQIEAKQTSQEVELLTHLFDKFYSQMGLNLLTSIYSSHLLYLMRQNESFRCRYYNFKLTFFQRILKLFEQKQQLISKLQISNQNPSCKTIDNNNTQINQKQTMNDLEISLLEMSGMLKKEEETEVLLDKIYWDIKKMKMCLIKNINIKQFFLQLTQFLLNQKAQQQLYESLVQYSVQCFEQRGVNVYMYLTGYFGNLQDSQTKNAVANNSIFKKLDFLKFLKKLQSDHSDKINLIFILPLYISLAQNHLNFPPRSLEYKKLLVKVHILFNKLRHFKLKQTDDEIDNITIKQILLQQLLLLSIRYVERIQYKSRRKSCILIRKLLYRNYRFRVGSLKEINKYMHLFIFELIRPSDTSILFKTIQNAHEKFAKKLILASLFKHQQNFLLKFSEMSKQKIDRQFKKVYQNNFRQQLFKKKFSRNEMFMDINDNTKTNQICDENYRKVKQQTIRLRKLLLKKELEILEKMVYKEKEKHFKEISWIKALNQ